MKKILLLILILNILLFQSFLISKESIETRLLDYFRFENNIGYLSINQDELNRRLTLHDFPKVNSGFWYGGIGVVLGGTPYKGEYNDLLSKIGGYFAEHFKLGLSYNRSFNFDKQKSDLVNNRYRYVKSEFEQLNFLIYYNIPISQKISINIGLVTNYNWYDLRVGKSDTLKLYSKEFFDYNINEQRFTLNESSASLSLGIDFDFLEEYHVENKIIKNGIIYNLTFIFYPMPIVDHLKDQTGHDHSYLTSEFPYGFSVQLGICFINSINEIIANKK